MSQSNFRRIWKSCLRTRFPTTRMRVAPHSPLRNNGRGYRRWCTWSGPAGGTIELDHDSSGGMGYTQGGTIKIGHNDAFSVTGFHGFPWTEEVLLHEVGHKLEADSAGWDLPVKWAEAVRKDEERRQRLCPDQHARGLRGVVRRLGPVPGLRLAAVVEAPVTPIICRNRLWRASRAKGTDRNHRPQEGVRDGE